MSRGIPFQYLIFSALLASILLSGCGPAATSAVPVAVPVTIAQTAVPAPSTQAAVPAPSTQTAVPATATLAPGSAKAKPDWFAIKLTDVLTGETFTINDFAGKVILVQTMAEWCPSCAYQQNEVKILSQLVSSPESLVVVSLDEDLHEDEPSLKKYANHFEFSWHFAVAPIEVDRALGNLYSAEYLNPPLNPMLIIDRRGTVYGLPWGFKSAEALKNTIEQYISN
jgi:thiol-disulfide isomerase/thioredoxin